MTSAAALAAVSGWGIARAAGDSARGYRFTDVAALRSQVGEAGTAAVTDHYRLAGDALGGLYGWDAAETRELGAIYVRPDRVAPRAPGRWVRQHVGERIDVRLLGAVPTDTPDDLASATEANLFNNRDPLTEAWRTYIRPNYVDRGIAVTLDFSAGMFGVTRRLLFWVDSGQGHVTLDGGGTGGVFYNKQAPLDGGEFTLLSLACDPTSYEPADPSTFAHDLHFKGMRCIDPMARVHSNPEIGEQSHGFALGGVVDGSITDCYYEGIGDEAQFVGNARRVWVDNNRFVNCVSMEHGDGGALSFENGAEDCTCGTNFFHDIRSAAGGLACCVNVKIIGSRGAHRLHLGTIVATGSSRIGVNFNSSFDAITDVTCDALIGEEVDIPIRHVNGAHPVERIRFGRVEVDECEGVDLRRVNLSDVHIEYVHLKSASDQGLRLGCEGLVIDHYRIDRTPGRLLESIAGSWTIGRLTASADCGTALTAADALVQGHARDQDLIVESGEIDAGGHTGHRVFSGVRRVRNVTVRNAPDGDTFLRIPELENIHADGNPVVVLHGGQAIRNFTIERSTGSSQGAIRFSAGSAGNVVAGGTVVNPGQPALGAGPGARLNRIEAIDYSACASLGNVGADVDDRGGHTHPPDAPTAR